MRFGALFCHALTLSGFGLSMWFAIGYPSLVGPMALFITSLIAALILASPIFEVAQGPKGAVTRLSRAFGRSLPYLGAFILLLLAFFLASIEQLARNGTLGLVITGLAALFVVLHGIHRTIGFWGFQRVAETLLITGYTGIAGALMAGQVQFSIAALSGLAFLQLFNGFVFDRSYGGLWGILFAFVIPLAMLIGLQIGHLLAIPLVLSFVIGFALNLPATTSRAGFGNRLGL